MLEFKSGTQAYAVRRVSVWTLLTELEEFKTPKIHHGEFVDMPQSRSTRFALYLKNGGVSKTTLIGTDWKFFETAEEAKQYAVENRKEELQKVYERGMEYVAEIEKDFNSTNGTKNLGLADEVYARMMETHNNDREWVEEIVEQWGAEACNRGYDIFVYHDTAMQEVCCIDEVGLFEDDQEAVKKAIQDGVKVIPVEELPEHFDRRYLGWIDTEENRKRIEEYCDKYCS